jgi:outer membrane lipoprotein-sorting protein
MLTPAAVLLAAAAPAAQPANDLVAVQNHLRAFQTMTASFSQTDRAGKVLTGTLTIKKPGKIRFQYEKGVPILVVAEGGALTFIDYSVRQVQRWPIQGSPLAVLLDDKRDLTRYGHVTATGSDRVISVEARDPKRPEFGRITLVLARQDAAPAGLTLQGWVALDSQGNRTTVRLSNQQYGVPVSDGTFRWNDPRKKAGRN